MAERYLEATAHRLSASYSRVDEHLRTSAAIDAVLGVAMAPERVDLAKGGLAGYLVMSARGDLRNALHSSGRRRDHEASIEGVEVFTIERKMYRDDPAADPTAKDAIASADERAAGIDLRGVARTETDEAVLRAMMEGERRTAAFAEILGLLHLDPVSQRAEVKKVKDRLKLRLRRVGKGAR